MRKHADASTTLQTRPHAKTLRGSKDASRPVAPAGGSVEATTILRQAASIIEQRAPLRDRQGWRSNARAALVFNRLRDKDLTEEDVCVLMVIVKLARASHGRDLDNFIDAASYCALAAEASERAK